MFNNCFIQSGVLGGREINAGKVDFPQVTVETLNIALSFKPSSCIDYTCPRVLFRERLLDAVTWIVSRIRTLLRVL